MGAPRYVERLTGAVVDRSVLGGKGAALDRLVGAGFPVPATAVVTTEAYRALTAMPSVAAIIERARRPGTDVGDDEIDATFLAAPVPEPVARAIAAAAHAVGGGAPVAVRSSATVEDLAGSSFAGQYRSLLDVDSRHGDTVLRAVALVWASMWHRAPRAYRGVLGVDDAAAAMAVVLMAMVPARRAGVVFTVDPAGEPGAARVEAVAGLGESLVSGRETPTAWVLPRDVPDGPGVLGDRHGVAVADRAVVEALELALAVERSFGVPQDVEWAWDGTTTWLVQARPITVEPPSSLLANGDGFDSPATSDELTTAGIEEMLPGVLPPLLWELDGHLVEEAFRRVLDVLGVLQLTSDARLIRRVRARAALDFTVLRAMAESLPGGDPDELESQYFGVVASAEPDGSTAGGRRPGPLAGLVHDLRVVAARRRAVRDAEVVIDAVDEALLAPCELDAFDDRALLSYRLRLVDLAQRGLGAELAVAAAAAASYRQLELLLSRHLDEAEARRQAQLLSTGGIDLGPHRDASAAVFAGPTWTELGEDPPGIEQRDPDERAAAVTALLDHLAAQPAWRRRRVLTGQVVDVRRHLISRTIADTVSQLARRERTKAAVMRLGGEVRRVHLELGRRLEARGALTRAGDVELFDTAELVRALGGDPPGGDVLARRRRYLRRCERDGPLPSRFAGSPDATVTAAVVGDRLEGWAASPGRRTGQATVVRGPHDPLPAGHVLVAAATDASWSPLFLQAAAIVVERGGPLSHAAILARELGVPAVLNLPGATTVLDGRWVTVDGDAGVVLLHSPDGPAAGAAAGGGDGHRIDDQGSVSP